MAGDTSIRQGQSSGSDGNNASDIGLQKSTVGRVELSRPIYLYGDAVHQEKTLHQNLSAAGSLIKRAFCPWQSPSEFLISCFPPVTWLRKYAWRADFVSDVLAGLTVGIMSVPEGLAYSKVAGMPPVYGLYTNTIPALVYFLLGTSKNAILGAITALALLTSDIRYKYIPCEDCWKNSTLSANAPIPDLTPIELGSTVTFLVGFYLVLMGLFRLSFVTRYLSDQVVGGFTIGVAVQVLSGQLDSIFGIEMPKRGDIGKTVMKFVDLFRLIDHTNVTAFLMFLPCFAFLMLLKTVVNPRVQPKLRFPLPGDLVVVICGILASYYGNVHSKYGVQIVGVIPAGLPKPVPPRFDLIHVFWTDSIAPAIVTYALSISLAKLFAKRNGYKVDPTQEFYAYGLMNLLGSFFQCFNAGQSTSRSMVAERSGGRTQLCAIVTVIVVVIAIVVIAPYMETLPSCVLSSIVVSACVMALANIRVVKTFYRYNKLDLVTYVVTAVGVIGLDLAYGLAAGVACGLLTVILRSQKAKVRLFDAEASILYSYEQNHSSVDRSTENESQIQIIQLTSPIFYANVEEIKDEILRISRNRCCVSAPEIVRGDQNGITKTKRAILIIDFSGVGFMDSMSTGMLKEVIREMEERQTDVFLCGCRDSHRRLMHRANLLGDSGLLVFPTLIDAVSYGSKLHNTPAAQCAPNMHCHSVTSVCAKL